MHLPGRGTRSEEPPFRRSEALVRAVADAIVPLLDRPVALFGHSVGAVIAFELARQLQARGRPVAHLFVAGRPAPPRRREVESYHLPRAQFIEVLKAFNGMPRDILDDPDVLDLVLPLLRADFEVSETYRYTPGPPLRCPLTAFGGAADPWVEPADIEAWGAHTSGAFAAHLFPSDHFFVQTVQGELLHRLAASLRSRAGWSA
jgi:surfactin synthase thioesterase subunit